MIEVVKYTNVLDEVWTDFVKSSRNATFILQRDYINYHQNRFFDQSLLFFDQSNHLIGIFPANISRDNSDTIISHEGLTYAGLILGQRTNQPQVQMMLDMAKDYYKKEGFDRIIYKQIPHIYHQKPSEEDLHWLFRNNAQLCAVNLSSAINLSSPLSYSILRKRKLNKSLKFNLLYKSGDLGQKKEFWQILNQVLSEKHSAKPVHTLEEISFLMSKFPQNILLKVVEYENEVVAGCVVYLTERVAHVQYIAANQAGRRMCALEFLFEQLIKELKPQFSGYIDFGISTENNGKFLNEGLLFQKEGMGGRGICYNSYVINI